MPDKQKFRVGKFSVGGEFLEEIPPPLQALLDEMIVLLHHQEYDQIFAAPIDRRIYIGIHPEFEEVEPGTPVPSYQVYFRREEDGAITRLPFEKIG